MATAPDFYLKLIAACVSAGFVLAVLAPRPRRAPHLLLAAFMLLIAANQGAETLRALTTDPGRALLWFKVASVAASLDPLLLLAFVAATPAGQGARRGLVMAGCAVGSVGLAAFALAGLTGTAADAAYSSALTVFTAIAYAFALWAVLRGPGDATPARIRLAAALAVVTFPVVVNAVVLPLLLPIHAWLAPLVAPPPRGPAIVQTALSLIALGMATGWVVWTSRRARLAPTGIVVPALVISILLNVSAFVAAVSPEWGDRLVFLGRSGAALRWLVFGAFTSVVLLKDNPWDLRLANRRRAARILLATTALVAMGVAVGIAAALGWAESLHVWEVGLAAVVLLSTQGFRRLVDRIARAAYGLPALGDAATRRETYRLAVNRATAQGRLPHDDAELARLREELELDEAVARAIERLADQGGPLAAGEIVAGRYRIERMVGRGGFGRVFLATDTSANRSVVLKELLDEGQGLEALRREATFAATLTHPNIVRVEDVLARQGAVLVVCEFMPGGTLEDALRNGPAASARFGWMEAVLSAAAALHAAGIVHGDLKPANVLLDAHGTPKVTDFGMARARPGWTARFGPGGALGGTPGTMAPEQALGQAATTASDVYALGLLIQRLGPWPPEVERLAARCLHAEPAFRPPDAVALHEAWVAASGRGASKGRAGQAQ